MFLDYIYLHAPYQNPPSLCFYIKYCGINTKMNILFKFLNAEKNLNFISSFNLKIKIWCN